MSERQFSLSENLTGKNDEREDHFVKAGMTAIVGGIVVCAAPVAAPITGIILGGVTFYQVMAGLEAKSNRRG